MKQYTHYFIIAILLFHILAAAWASYDAIVDFRVLTLYHAYPIMLWVFTAVWFGIFLKKRWCAFAYFMLVFFEIANKLFFGQFEYGKVFGSVLFPLNLIFAFVILTLYRQHFGDRKNEA